MAITNVEATKLVQKALLAGATFSLKVPAGTITCGPIASAVASTPKFGCYVYGRGSWASPEGKPTGHDYGPNTAAYTLVEYAGRGAAAKAAKEALSTLKK